MGEDSQVDWAGIIALMNPYDKGLGIACTRSVDCFTQLVQAVKREFHDLFESQSALNSVGALRGCRKMDADEVELRFLMNCRKVYEAWRASGELNPLVKSFNGEAIMRLIHAIETLPSVKKGAGSPELNSASAELDTAVARLEHLVEVSRDSEGRAIHGVSLREITAMRSLLKGRGKTMSATKVVDTFRGKQQTANLTLRVLERLGEFDRFKRKPIKSVNLKVDDVIRSLKLPSK